MKKKVQFLTWTDVDNFVDELTIRYATKEFSGVYGVPRGGTVLAVMISHAMGIPFLGAPCDGCLVVDDVSDSGITLQHYQEKGYEIATMFCHPSTKVIPNYYRTLKSDEWLVFPWERTSP